MHCLSRIYVSRFGSPTAWYDQLLFDLTDPDTRLPTDVIFNLENAGGKTSLLSYLFSCFDPKQERWLQHLQNRKHRFSEYFARDGRPSFIVMEWNMSARAAGQSDYKLIIGQAVASKQNAERGADIDRWFFAFEVIEGMALEDIPAPRLQMIPVRSMQEFVQWMHRAGNRAADFFHTKTQEDWVKHLGTRLLDIDLLRMQVEFNSNEGGMKEGFLTFKSESDLVRRFLLLTLDSTKSVTVRDLVAQTADKLQSMPRYERRLEQLTRLQSVMVPFSQAADLYEAADKVLKDAQKQASGLSAAMRLRCDERRRIAQENLSYAQVQDEIATTATDNAIELRADVVTMQGLQHDRKVDAMKDQRELANFALTEGKRLLRCIEGAKALVHVEDTRTRVEGLEASVELERAGLKPARQQAEIQGALLTSSLHAAEKAARQRKIQAETAEHQMQSLIAAIDEDKSAVEQEIRSLSAEKGQLNQFEATYGRQRQLLIQEHLIAPDDPGSAAAIERLEQQAQAQETTLQALNKERHNKQEIERNLRQRASNEALKANQATAAQDPHKKLLADGEALREELKQLAVLRAAADAEEADPDSPVLLEALNQLLADSHRQIADRNVRFAQLSADRGSIVETGLANRNIDVDTVARQFQGLGIRSARTASAYVAELRPDVEDARALVMSDPARFLGVNVAQGEWSKVREFAPNLKIKLTAPVTVAVASVTPSEESVDRLVLSPHDDAAYNKEAAQAVQAALDARIADAQSQRAAYEQRRDQAVSGRGKLEQYQSGYGAARLRQALADIERLQTEEQAAERSQQELSLGADQAQESVRQIEIQTGPMPQEIARLKSGVIRLEVFQQEFERTSADKRARLVKVQALVENKQAQLNGLLTQRSETETRKRNTMKDRLHYETEADNLILDRGRISYCDASYPADEQLLAKPRSIEALKIAYDDAVSTLQTEERHRLGVLAEKLDNARQEYKKAIAAYDNKFSDLNQTELEPLRKLDIENALRDQYIAVEQLDTMSREADTAMTVAETERSAFWKNHKHKSLPNPDMQAKSDEELAAAIKVNENQTARHDAAVEQATQEAENARRKGHETNIEVSQLETLHSTLDAAIPCDGLEVDPIALTDDIAAYANELISTFRKRERQLNQRRGKAQEAFQKLTNAVHAKELVEVEPELARDIADSEFEPACSDHARIVALIEDRISATRDTLDGMKPDFENCVGEIYNLTFEGISLLKHACDKTMPTSAPYVGGKPILRMKTSFSGISVQARKEAIRGSLNAMINSNIIPASGADLVAECLVAISGRRELGLEILKMEQNETHQYQLAGDLKGSMGQGTVIAMFLYLLISQLRADTLTHAKRGGSAPLILDNPFANVQTRALIDAQRLLAKEIGVQLVFFTAVADYNVLAGFRRVTRLRKTGANMKTKRSHIEMVSAVFEHLTEPTTTEV